ncbi:MAG: heavy metal translocating P-type ATPase [Prochloraceae cyanobacterium]|nr:heavy metal translocating P-type ATPase [Prochloraceae cyanobacterium]
MEKLEVDSARVLQNQIKLQNQLTSVANNNNSATTRSEVAYKIVHATPGRVRVRIPRVIHDLEYTRSLQALASLDDRVLSVCVKPDAASVTICYKSKGYSEAELRSGLKLLIQLASDRDACIAAGRALKRQEQEAEASYWSAMKLPVMATALSLLGGPFGITIPSVIIKGTIALATLPIAQRAWESITKERKLNTDFLDLSAISIVTAQSHFLTSCSMVVLIELGEAIRDHTARSSHRQTLDLLSSLSQFVWVERDGCKQQIPIEQVMPEDTVIVYPGEQIPVDGSILKGKALIDEHKLTGESMPVVRTKGQEVYASTLVREGQIYILAERVGADTRAGRTIQLIEEAPVHDTRMENYAAKIADRAVLPTLLLSGAIFSLTGNVARTASVLTIDFATGIRVSVPTTIMAALIAAARSGILIRCGRALEKLAQVDAIVCDKTGTLTQGEVTIVGIKTAASSIEPSKVLELAAAAEQRITHPVAEAIMRYAQSQGATILPRGKWQYQVGFGIRAEIDGQTVLVGSERYLVKEEIDLERLYDRYLDLKTVGYPTIYVASNGEALGAIQYADPLRSESKEVIQTLQEQFGTEIYLLTGDNQQRANLVAKELNIPPRHVCAEAFPEQKAEVIKKLHARGKTVAFVGDGLNDSAGLAYADVSVSFRDGSEVARETADVVLMKNDLRGLVEAIAIARHAQKIIRQNTGIVALPNLYGMAIAGTVGMNPMTATFINNGSSVIAGVNGLRPLLTDGS